jgi:hypothetical protein
MSVDGAIDEAGLWCEQVRGALEQEPRGGDDLPRLLDHLDTGTGLRRTLDHQSLAGPSEACRRAVLRQLTELRQAVNDAIDDLVTESPGRDVLAGRVKHWLAEAKTALRELVADHRLDPLGRALGVEGLRGDLDWYSAIIARLDGEPLPSRIAALEVELDRVHNQLALKAQADSTPDTELGRLLGRCERLRGVLLERRARRELSMSTAEAPAERLLALRLHLSRLQARVASLEQVDDDDGHPRWLGGDPEEWAEALSIRRIELADRAAAELQGKDLTESRKPCERAAQAASDEVSEMIAFLEDMPLRRAVKRLELAREDLDQVTLILRRQANAVGPENQAAGLSQTALTDLERDNQLLEAEDLSLASDSIGRHVRDLERLKRRIRGQWQEKLLALRLEELLGPRLVRVIETGVLWLILILVGLIAAEALLDRTDWISDELRPWLAWADLAICTCLLAEFALRLTLAPLKVRYFLRHFVIDFLASLPFGFLAFQLGGAGAEAGMTRASESLRLLRLLRFGRLVQLLRYVRVALPVVRLARLLLFLLRLSDRLIRKHAGLLNRNIVLFEPYHAHRPESSDRHRLASLKSEQEHASALVNSRLDRGGRKRLAERILADLDIRIETLPAEAFDGDGEDEEGRNGREIPVEALVDRLIQISPERLVDRMGPGFVTSADRYLRLLDVPLLRRMPVIRNLVAYRQKSPAEAVTLAANYLGNLIQRFLEVIYFLADLQGTLSPAVFLDRLGAAIVSATRTPAKRLLWLGSAFFLLFLVVNGLAVFQPFRGFVDRLQTLLGWPVIILGGICLCFWLLGSWFRKIANQSADFCERVVEAQFAAQTKNIKSRRRDQDAQFLAERVIDPELLLRSSDDLQPELYRRADQTGSAASGKVFFENRELIFLRNIRLLYQDYLDGSPFHRSDTKASVQLLGNLALTNLRRSHLGHLLREGRALDRLDLNRAGRLFGGPYLWFTYITRMIVQETAILLLDYNRHAVPLDRLACSPAESRQAFQKWLARRLKIEPEEVFLPEPVAPPETGLAATTIPHVLPRRPEASAFLETVEFTAIDFLADDAQRDATILERFGPQVAELVRRDRQQNVRRAFRSFPLHELPLDQRTINPYAFYETYLSRGRIIFLPFLLVGAAAKTLVMALRGVFHVVHEILHPRVDQDQEIPSDTYWAARRKIHRMRKPVFMGSLWLRARFDVEYLGLQLPTAPPGIAAHSLMERDLDFIGASRQDRIIAEQIRRGHQRRLQWIGRWLHQFGWTFEELPGYLSVQIPYLTNRGGEALRALVTALVLDHDDITSLAFSIEGLKRVLVHGADASLDGKMLPPGLPDPVINLRKLWHPVAKVRRPTTDLFRLPCFPSFDQAQQKRILSYLRRHRRAVRGWVKVVLGQGGEDPFATVRARMREVLLRTDLWSDQVLVLRAVQTLTMLDVQHNCDLVWSLGGYTRPTSESPATDHPFADRRPDPGPEAAADGPGLEPTADVGEDAVKTA